MTKDFPVQTKRYKTKAPTETKQNSKRCCMYRGYLYAPHSEEHYPSERIEDSLAR